MSENNAISLVQKLMRVHLKGFAVCGPLEMPGYTEDHSSMLEAPCDQVSRTSPPVPPWSETLWSAGVTLTEHSQERVKYDPVRLK